MNGPPTTSAEFDRAYRAPLTFWGDVRIPNEIKALAQPAQSNSRTSCIELGCGVGRLTHYLAQRGLRATGVDFSPVAIAKARAAATASGIDAEFWVGDVTALDPLCGPFDVAFDVGCFHCLHPAAQRAYSASVSRLLAVGGTHLIWALDESPSGIRLSAAAVAAALAPHLKLLDSKPSRRRLARAHWYWLERQVSNTDP